MPRHLHLGATLALAISASGCAPVRTTTTAASVKERSAMHDSQPATLAHALMNRVFNEKQLGLLDQLVGDTYVQHNPMGHDGKAGLAAMLQYVSPRVEIVRTLVDGDLVVLHNRSTGWGDGKSYVSFDVFRVADGRIVEHWDVMQEVVEKTASGRSQTDGPTAVGDRALTEESRRVVRGFVDDCLYAHNWQNLTRYLSTERYDQHNPNVKDGLAGLDEALQHMAKAGQAMRYDKTYRVVADGAFVFVHSRGEFGGKPVAFADLMRVEGGKVVEHWDAIQPVGAPNPAGHDMFEQLTR